MATSTSEDFTVSTDPFRRELLAHCYRMLGSVHDVRLAFVAAMQFLPAGSGPCSSCARCWTGPPGAGR